MCLVRLCMDYYLCSEPKCLDFQTRKSPILVCFKCLIYLMIVKLTEAIFAYSLYWKVIYINAKSYFVMANIIHWILPKEQKLLDIVYLFHKINILHMTKSWTIMRSEKY